MKSPRLNQSLRQFVGSLLVSAGGVLLASASASAVAQDTKNRKGAILYLQCKACHSLAAGEPHKAGPNLHQFLVRKSATAPDYTYTDALKKSGLEWNDKTLLDWIEAPHKVVPGTKMLFGGVTDAGERQALIAYLREATK